MKAVKILLKTVLWVVAIAVLALLTLPLWFGPVAKGVANAVVPKVVQTEFNLAHLSLNPYTARFELAGLQLDNPAGYSEKIAAKVGELNFDAETASLLTEVIHIEEITLKDVFVSYVDGGENKVNNFQQIQYNVAGGKDKYEAAQAAKEAEARQVPEVGGKPESATTASAAEEKTAGQKPAKKVIIDRLTVSGIKIQLGILPIAIPFDIKLTDIGRKSGGATFAEAGQEIWSGIMNAAGSTGGMFKALGGKASDAAAKATESLNKAAKAADAAKAAGENAGKALDSIKKLW